MQMLRRPRTCSHVVLQTYAPGLSTSGMSRSQSQTVIWVAPTSDAILTAVAEALKLCIPVFSSEVEEGILVHDTDLSNGRFEILISPLPRPQKPNKLASVAQSVHIEEMRMFHRLTSAIAVDRRAPSKPCQ